MCPAKGSEVQEPLRGLDRASNGPCARCLRCAATLPTMLAMRPTNLLALAALTITAFLGCVTTAGAAATRYAADTSAVTSGACATEAGACRLDYAINSAAAGDTVIVLPGDYTVTYSVLATQLVHVRGKAGQARPRLLGGAALTGATLNLPKGGTAEHLYVESQSSSSALSTK